MKTRTKSHRRILSAAVALVLCLSLLPITAKPAFAEGEELTVYTFSELQTEAALPSSTYDIITLGGSIIGNEQLDIGRTLTLRLNDYDLTIDAAVGDGIKIADGVRLDITDSANSQLSVHGDGAGIHVPLGSELRISGGMVEATGNNGAGIGGSMGSGGGNITIEDGNITATGGPQHAGIEGLNVNIHRGNITATGGVGGAGIGGGLFDSIGYIYINDGVITATGGDAYSGVGGGAGIGGGGGNATSNIAIYGGNITAIGGGGGAGIGGGGGISSGCNILITGENTVVDATGDTDAQDIGRGRDGTAGDIFVALPTANLTLASQSSNTVKFTAEPSSDGTVTATLPAPFNASPPFSAGGVYNLLTEPDVTGKTMSVVTTFTADDSVTFALADYANVSKTGTELMTANATVAFRVASALTGTATISNMNPRIGGTLTGSLVGGNNTGTLTYQWKVDGANAGAGATYTVQTADLGKTITLEITSSVETGTVTSTTTAAVLKKAAPAAPGAPALSDKTHNSVTLTANALHEYSKDGTTWQTSNVFGGLSASTAYTFYQRIAETADTEASPSSPALNETTNASPDTTAPTGEIVLGTHGWNSFINTITFGLFCKNTQTVTIEDIADDQSADEDVTVEYYLADSAKTSAELAAVTWTAYTGSFTIQPGKYVIYAKLTDEANNSATISSDGIVVFTDSAQDTAAISYTKGTNADVPADVTLNDNTIAKIMNGAETLTLNTDYTVSGDTITFKGTYLETLAANSYTLTVSYKPQGVEYPATPITGSDAPGTTTIGLTVSDPAPPTPYVVTVSGGTGGGDYAEGAAVTITAGTPPTGQRFKDWTFSPAVTFTDGTSMASATAKFTMPGQAVTATANYENIPPSAIAVTGVTLNQTSLSLYSNTSPNTATLTATVAPTNATAKSVTWASGNPAVATIDQSGKVTAVADGTAIITVTTTDGGYMASCTVTVSTATTPNVYDVINHFDVWNGSGTASARIDADHTKFVRLTLGGAEIHPSNYTITQGSTIVTLKESHLSTYPNGTHTLVAHFIGGYSADIPLTVNKQAAGNTNNSNPGTGVPQTGDSSNMAALWIALICTVVGILCLTVWRKRQRMASGK